MPLISLHSFCKAHGFPKSSVHSYLTKTCKFDVSKGLTMQAQEVALEKFAKKVKVDVVPPDVLTGNSAEKSSLGPLPNTVDLSQFRSSQKGGQLTGVNASIQAAFSFMDYVEAGMEIHEGQEENRLLDTSGLGAQLSARLGKFQQRKATYEMRTYVLDLLQKGEEKKIEDLVGELTKSGEVAPSPDASNNES